jgi:hypothetical protein
MSDPQRLLSDTSLDPTGRLLLESWQQDGPPADGRARTLAALGIVSGATIGAAASLGSIAPKAVASLSLVKWIGLAALIGIVTLGGSIYLKHSASDIKVPASVSNQSPTTKDPISTVPEAAASSVAFESADPTPARATPSTRRIAKPNESIHTSDRLSGQIALIDSARRALSSGDVERAETLAVDYETKFPQGTFGEEAEAIRITALSENGDAPKARALGAAFLRAHPSSAYAARIRLLVDGANP